MENIDEMALAERHDSGAIREAGRFGKFINKIGVVFAVGILASAAILVLEVILRYVFNAPTLWAHETVIFLNASAFIFGGLYAVARDEHIRVVLIYDRLKGNTRRWFNVLISLTNLTASLMFSWAAWQMVKKAVWTPAGDFRLETSGSAWNPPFPGMLKLFLLFILICMAIQFLILAFHYATEKTGDKS